MQEQQSVTPSTALSEKQTIHKKGSLVIRAVRSVRSLAQIPSLANIRNTEAKDKTSENDAGKAKSSMPPVSGRLRRKPGLPLRRPTTDSGSSWEVGALSSPDRSGRSTLLVPAERRRHSEMGPDLRPPPIPRRASDTQASFEPSIHPLHAPQPSEESNPAKARSRPNVRFNPDIPGQADKRVSIISILSTDGTGADSSSNTKEVKEQRRSSTASSIRWDPEVMSQQAKKARLEERRRLRREREAERAKTGVPTPIKEQKREKSMSARRRTPLSEVFDLDISSVSPSPSSEAPTQVPQMEHQQTAVASAVACDPIVAATEALLREAPKRSDDKSELASVEIPRLRLKGKELMHRPRPVGIVVVDDDKTEGQ